MTTSVDISPDDNNDGKSSKKNKISENSESTSSLVSRVVSTHFFDSFCIVLAELIGTGALLFFGCAGTMHWNGDPGIRAPLNFGVTVMMIIQIFGHISFALLNPAVNIVAVVYKLISIKMGFILTIAQIVGAALGYGLLQFVAPEDIFSIPEGGTCMTQLHPGVPVAKAFLIEFLLTCALVSLICGVWDPRNQKNSDSSPLRVGFGIFALSVAGGEFTGASMNPVRSLGPALWNWNWDNHWIYWVAPPLAGLVASLFYRLVFWRNHPATDEEVERLSEKKVEL